MSETAGYLPVGSGGRLFAVFHPADSKAPAAPAVLVVGPLLDEARGARGALAALARALAGSGCPVLRFDFRGAGDSSGRPEAMRLATLEEDLAAAAGALSRLAGAPRALSLLGLRFGATLALRAAAGLRARAVCALAPIVRGNRFWREARLQSGIREALTAGETEGGAGAPSPRPSPGGRGGESGRGTGAGDPGSGRLPPGVLDFGGFPVSESFVAETSGLDLAGEAGALGPGTEVLLLPVAPGARLGPEIERVLAIFVERGVRARAEGLALPPFWAPIEPPDLSALESRVVRFLAGGS